MSLPGLDALMRGEGSIHVIIGPMYAGKSRELLERLNRGVRAGQECCLVRAWSDDRWADELTRKMGILGTHGGEVLPVSGGVKLVQAATLEEAAASLPEGCNIVAVDEGQFFPDLSRVCVALALQGVLVYVSALNGSYEQVPWQCVSDLLANCDGIVKLHAQCQHCKYRPAHFTRRLPGLPPVPEGGFDVAGADRYEAVCRLCLTNTA